MVILQARKLARLSRSRTRSGDSIMTHRGHVLVSSPRVCGRWPTPRASRETDSANVRGWPDRRLYVVSPASSCNSERQECNARCHSTCHLHKACERTLYLLRILLVQHRHSYVMHQVESHSIDHVLLYYCWWIQQIDNKSRVI